jgi:hypothetical protein
MADTTGYITFTDVGVSGPGGTGLFNDATLFIDYTTGSVVVVGGGNLTFTTPSSQTFSFSGPEMHVTQVPRTAATMF